MKAIIFDFDGTLTDKNGNVWKDIWKNLGYDTGKESYYSELYLNFIKKEISHQQWCDLTCEAFAKQNLDKRLLNQISDKHKLICGAEQVFKSLKEAGVSLHIVSGCIDYVIERILGENSKYFDSINANNFSFDDKDRLVKIKGTKFDFDGKAKFINEYIEKTNIMPNQICFVGNSDNDEWAYLSGCKTLCVNPDNTSGDNSTVWHRAINTDNLTQILPEIEQMDELNLSMLN